MSDRKAPPERAKYTARLELVSDVLKHPYAKVVASPSHIFCGDMVGELMRDFHDAISTKGKDYYLGTIVLEQRADGSLRLRDGHKRLLTIAMLLDGLRSRLDGTKTRRREGYARQAATCVREFLDGLHEGLSERARLTILRCWRTFVERRVMVATVTAPPEVFRRVVVSLSRRRVLHAAEERTSF